MIRQGNCRLCGDYIKGNGSWQYADEIKHHFTTRHKQIWEKMRQEQNLIIDAMHKIEAAHPNFFVSGKAMMNWGYWVIEIEREY